MLFSGFSYPLTCTKCAADQELETEK